MLRFRALLLAALTLGGCSDELRGPAARDFVNAADRALSTFESSPETEALLDRAKDAAWALDAAGLHGFIPDVDNADRTRALFFEIGDRGRRRWMRHRVAPKSIDARKLFEVRTVPPREDPSELGRYSLLLASEPLSSGNYRLRVSSAIDTGGGDLGTIWRAVPDALRFFERGAEAAEARRVFPKTAAFVERYLEIESSVRPHAPRGKAVEIIVRGRRAAAAADYPNLAHYVARMSKSVQSSGALQTEEGVELVGWRFRGREEGFQLSFATGDGQLVTRDAKGDLVDLTRPQKLRIAQSMIAEALGISTSIEGVRSRAETEPLGAAPEIAVQTNGDPDRIAVEGALFGVVPIAALDAMVPGTLESSMKGILATLLRGRGGRGVEILMLSRALDEGAHETSSTLVADVPAGSFSRRALRLGTALIQASASERDDVLRFTRDLVDCVVADLG